MKPRSHVTTVLLVATFATVGCSKDSATSQRKAGATSAAPAPAAQSDGLTTAKAFGEDGFSEDAVPTLTSPVSFADGETAYQARKYGDATAIFERYIVERPKNPWGHYMLGLSAWKGGDLTKAEQAFEQALALDPQHMKSLVNLSRVFIDAKKHDEAIDRLTRAAEIDPESVQVLRLLGRTYHGQGRTEEAIATYQRAIEVNELDVWSMNNLGLLLLEAGRADEALPLFSKAVERRSDVAAFHNNLGMALEHTGRFLGAATAYKEALAADPGYAKARKNLARVEAVKSGPDAPFVIEPAATVVEGAELEADAKTASK